MYIKHNQSISFEQDQAENVLPILAKHPDYIVIHDYDEDLKFKGWILRERQSNMHSSGEINHGK